MKTKTEKVLPKIMLGTVHAQFVRCGKPNCKCSRGELHGAYYYHFVRVQGKLRKRYLKASEVDEAQRACALRQIEVKAQREKSQTTWQTLRELRESLRDFTNQYNEKGE